MKFESISDLIGNTPVVHLSRMFRGSDTNVYVKLEGANPFGSSKDRVAKYLIERGLADGTLVEGCRLVESSSGNLGIALALLCPMYGFKFTCVVDPLISRLNLEILRSTSADIDMVVEGDSSGSYLESRIARVAEIVRSDTSAVWVNQYSNPGAWQAHYKTTAGEIIDDFPDAPDFVVVGVSTTATAYGISRCIRDKWKNTKVVAVDAYGSIAFGGEKVRRRLPGLGAGRVSTIASSSDFSEVIYVQEEDAISCCRKLLIDEGIMVGASSGAVVSAIEKISERSKSATIVGVLADRGERYTDSVFVT